MPSEEHWPEHLPGPKQMMEIGPAMPLASRAGASGIEGRGIVGEACVPQVMNAGGGIGAGGTAGPGWDHAIEHVDTALDRAENIVWRSNPHEIARRFFGKMGDGGIERIQHDRLPLPDRQSANGVAIEFQIFQCTD